MFFAKNNKYPVCDPVPEAPGGITIFDGTAPAGSLRLASMKEIQERAELTLVCNNYPEAFIEIILNDTLYYLNIRDDKK